MKSKVLSILLIVLTIIACDKDKDKEKLKLNAYETTISIGETKKIEVLDRYKNEEIEWSSSNPDCVEVSNGIIKGKREGTASIKASVKNDKGIYAICKVIVKSEVLTAESLLMPIYPLGITKKELEELEKNSDGKYNKEKSNPEEGFHEMMWFDHKDKNDFIHIFFISHNGKGNMDECWIFYKDTNIILDKNGTGFSLKQEFINILTTNGFSEPQYIQEENAFITSNEKKKIDIKIVPTEDEMTGRKEPVLLMEYGKYGEYSNNI